MTQFDPNMVAQMLMQPIQRASENLGGGPFGIGADAGGSFFVDPEVAARTGYGTAVTGTSFFPGAGIVDAYGGAVDVTGQPLPSFSENIREGQFTDAGLQALGVAGDIATIAAPLTGGASALVGAMMKAPRAAQKSSAIFNSVDRFPSLSKSEESLVAASSAPDEEIAGLGKVVVEKVDSNDLEGSRKRFKELKDLTANYKQDRAKARLIKLDTGEDAIQYMQPPTEVTTLNISDLTATQSDVVLGGDASLSDNMPLVVKKEGKFFIRDGHHRLAQKAISGESSAEVRLVDLDKGADVASDVGNIAKVEPQSLPLDKASRLERARELGFDVDNPIYHGTNTDKLTEFDESKIGSRDEGFFGRGFYFADNAGEAGYYGKNVGEYFVRGDLLDLTDTSGEPNYLGSPLVFINWAEKLDKIDMLDDTHKQALKGAKKVVKYFDENVKILPAQNADGTTGFTAKIIDPTDDGFDGDPREIFMRSRYDDDFPKTQEEAKERLFYQFADDVRTSFNKDTDFFEGFDNDFLFSLSDYIREGGDVMGLNASKLTEKAKEAGFDGIRAGDETVIFDAKNIRSSDAAFDPEKTDSPQLLSSVMQDSMTAVA